MAEKQPHVKGDGKLPLSSGRFNSLHSVNDLMMVMIHLLICMHTYNCLIYLFFVHTEIFQYRNLGKNHDIIICMNKGKERP